MRVVSILKHRLSTGLLVGLLLSVSGAQWVNAATTRSQAETANESITMSPVSQHYQLDAGQSLSDELTIVNDGDSGYTFNLYASPYSVNDDSYEPDFSSERKNTDVDDWVEFAKSSYYIEAGQTLKVGYTITVPRNASPGGHYGVLFAETEAAKLTGGTGVERKKRVGAIVYATVNGTYESGGRLANLTVPSLQFRTPLFSEISIQNTGNSDFATKTSFLITDAFGRKKYEVSKDYQVLPESTRKIRLEWPQATSFGLYKVTATAEFLDQDAAKSSYVLMAPVWMYLITVIGLLALVIYFIQKRR